MTSGTIGAPCWALLSWTPEIAKSKLKHALGFDSEAFGKDGHGEKAKAYKCNECKKIIIDLLDDFNKFYK